MPAAARRLNGIRKPVIREMIRIAGDQGAINLAQGFPDHDPPEALPAAAGRRLLRLKEFKRT